MSTDAKGPWEGLTVAGGRYRSLTTIGVGGMGYVYRGIDGNLNSDVVIKSPRASMLEDKTVAERFEQEIRALVKLSFPHIVKVTDVGRHEGVAFIVMPYLSGGNLFNRMQSGSNDAASLPEWRSMRTWLPNIAAALDFVHRSGFVHRDVKPQNILFDQFSLSYLSDFGIVKAIGLKVGADTARYQTNEGFHAGTVDYMSPEVLTSDRFDGRADQYSLAVTIYQYLTGTLPFAAESIVLTIDRHLHAIPTPIGALVPRIPPHVSAAVAKALAKSPSDRFADCTQFIRALLAEPSAAATTPDNATAKSPPIAAAPTATTNASATAAGPTGMGPNANGATAPAPPLIGPAVGRPLSPVAAAVPSSRPAPSETLAGFSVAPAPRAPAPGAEAYEVASLPKQDGGSTAAPRAPAASGRNAGPAETMRVPTAGTRKVHKESFWKTAALWKRVAVGLSLAGIIATICLGAVLTFDTDLPPSTGLDSNNLPRLIDDWKKQATEVEKLATIDSKSLLESLEYSSKKDLERLLDSAGKQAPPEVVPAINALEIDLTTLARIHGARSEQLHQLRETAKSQQTDPKTLDRFEVEDTELKDQGTQLVSMAHRLKTLRDSTELPRSAYDAAAVKELRILDDMERIVAAKEPVTVSTETAERSEVLAHERNPDLAWRGLNVLARSSSHPLTQIAVQRINTFTPERQAELAYSLLLSSQADAVNAAVRRLRDDAEIRKHLDRERLLSLAESNPSRYQELLPVLASTSDTTDDRWRVFVMQAPLMREEWSGELERACTDGLLRERADEVVCDIIQRRRKKSYALAERLMTKTREFPIHRFKGDELTPLLTEAPSLAGLLAERWLLRGTAPLRTAAVAAYAATNSSLDKPKIRKALTEQKIVDPTALVNMLLLQESPGGVELAEFLLLKTQGEMLDKIDYASASTQLMHKPEAVKVLLARAWKSGEAGRIWSLGRLLGGDYVRRVGEAQEGRDEDFKMLARIMPILGGQLVVLPNSPTLGKRDRGLKVEMKDVIRLPRNIEPAKWAADGEKRKRLALLRSEVASLKAGAIPSMVEALDALDLYLVDLEALTQTCAEISNIYDLTVQKQLPGAFRELSLAKLEAWDFRYSSVLIASYERENVKYQALQKSIPQRRAAVPLP